MSSRLLLLIAAGIGATSADSPPYTGPYASTASFQAKPFVHIGGGAAPYPSAPHHPPPPPAAPYHPAPPPAPYHRPAPPAPYHQPAPPAPYHPAPPAPYHPEPPAPYHPEPPAPYHAEPPAPYHPAGYPPAPPPPPPSAPYHPAGSPYQPAGPPPGECALRIPAAPGYNNEEKCVTYEAVNAAFSQAKDRFRLSAVHGKFSPKDVGQLSTVIYEASRTLAEQYQLDKNAIADALPLIDTTQTLIENYCPPFLMTPKCELSRYRSIEGLCNNLENPHWGAAMNAHNRFLPPDYADGVSDPRISVTGQPLPSARLVSSSMHKDEGWHDHAVTIMLVAWGQFIDHDITLTAETKNDAGMNPKCCDGPEKNHPECFPIDIPHTDSFYSKYRRSCMSLVRNQPGLRANCKLGPREQFNDITSTIDAGVIYANEHERAQSLRTFKGGLMKSLPAFEKEGLKDLLPLKLENPDAGCIRPSDDVFCFLGGDPRVNEQVVLVTIHMMFVREHNRIATELAKINPHWDDETLYQESRHIVAALMQHINYNEFLPMVLGREIMTKHQLTLETHGYFRGYDKETNPTVANGFIAAAFRFGHTLLPSVIERWSPSHRYIESQKLSEMLTQPYDLFKPGYADNYLMGLVNQVAQAYDGSVTSEVTNHLFQEPGKHFGLDLAALNIQRGREHGVPSYGRWREFCGLPALDRWEDLHDVMANNTVYEYSQVYAHPNDIDLWSAGISEKPVPGAMLGPTFACIIAKQFRNFRFGDRFWYENGNQPSSFTLEQLEEIRKIKLSRVVCDNSDHMDTVQVFAMVLPDYEINPRVPCNAGVLPSLDLTKWRDASPPPYHG